MLSLLTAIWLSLSTLAPQQNGILQGTVRRGGTSEPISGVEMSLIQPESRMRFRTVSDAEGRFVFDALPFGRYMLQAAREGYFTYPRGVALPQPVASVTVDASRNYLFVDLTPGAAIGGRVTDPQGRPLHGVQMSAMELQYRDGRPAFGVGSLPKPTDDRGEFRLFWFPPGEYYLRAEYSSDQNNLARKSYYPGTVDSSSATTLLVRGGESLDNLNFVIPAASSVRVSGQVAPDVLGPVTGLVKTFYLLPLDGRPLERYPLEFTNMLAPSISEAGPFPFAIDLRGVAPGLYDLAPFYMDRSNAYHSGRTRIEIRDENIENITAIITPNVAVSGRIIMEGENAFQGFSALQLQLRANDTAVPLMSRTSFAKIEPDGAFVIPDIFEGRYQLYFSAAARTSDLYVSEIRQGGQDIRNEGTVDVRGSMPPLEIRIRAGAGTIRGNVEGPGGVIASQVDVVLVPQIPFRENTLFYDRTTTSETGEFKFEDIAPGEYKVFAFGQLPDTAEQNARFIARYETLGQIATVKSRMTTELRVRLVR